MSERILKLPDVIAMTALSRSSLYAYAKEGRFPVPIPLGPKAVGWKLSEVVAWIDERTKSRNSKQKGAI